MSRANGKPQKEGESGMSYDLMVFEKTKAPMLQAIRIKSLLLSGNIVQFSNRHLRAEWLKSIKS